MSDKEFGQLGQVAKDKLGLEINPNDIEGTIKEGVAKFQNLSPEEKKKLTDGLGGLDGQQLGKFESAAKKDD